MTADEAKASDFYSNARTFARMIHEGITGLRNLQPQFNYGGYGPAGANPLPNGTGANEGITAAEVGAAVFDTADALKTVLDNGHGANLEKLF